jgi:hypothetical protein
MKGNPIHLTQLVAGTYGTGHQGHYQYDQNSEDQIQAGASASDQGIPFLADNEAIVARKVARVGKFSANLA